MMCEVRFEKMISVELMSQPWNYEQKERIQNHYINGTQVCSLKIICYVFHTIIIVLFSVTKL
jgi:hypothetical protein